MRGARRNPGLIVLTQAEPRPDSDVGARAAALVAAAAVDHDVHVVVTVDAHPPGGPGFAAEARLVGAASLTHVELTGPDGRRRSARDLVAHIQPVLGAVDARSIVGVLAGGLDLAPFALGLTDLLGLPLILDAAGDHEGMLRTARPEVQVDPDWYLAAGCVTEASLVLATSADEAEALDEQFHLSGRVAVLPDVAAPVAWQVDAPRGTGNVLYRADFTRPADLEGARWLVQEVLPHLPPAFTLELVGPAGDEAHALAQDGVRVHGAMADRLAAYQQADVAVAPHQQDGRGRGAILEAFVHRRAVVSTSAAAAGLALTAGVHLRAADAPDAFATALVASAQPKSDDAAALVERQVDEAARVVAERHHPEVVQAEAAGLLAAATGAVRPRSAA